MRRSTAFNNIMKSNNFKVVWLSTSGNYATVKKEFLTLQDAISHAESGAIVTAFYDFYCVLQHKIVINAPEGLEAFKGKSVKMLVKMLESHAYDEEVSEALK